MLEKNHKILVAGSRGMVGSALVRLLRAEGFSHLLTPSRQELDYTEQAAVRKFLRTNKPDVILIAAAKVGGIWANMTYPAEFLSQNVMIATNLIHEAHQADVGHLLFLGSSCIYPRLAPQPILERALLTAPLEKTNEAYALAKIVGVKLCEHYQTQFGRRYLSAMPTNLYGPGDNYHPQNSHVIPALIQRFHEAKVRGDSQVQIWGTGKALREFLFVDDLARACLMILRSYTSLEPINVGSEDEVTILELAQLIAECVGFKGSISHDLTKPDGTPRKKCDLSKITAHGWKPKVSLKEGLALSYKDFLSRQYENPKK